MENIQQRIEETDKKIDNLDNKINTDEELIKQSNEIKWIYNKIKEIDTASQNIQEENDKQYINKRLLEIKRKFTDLTIDWKINWEFTDVVDSRRFDAINKNFIDKLNNIIAENFNKIDIKEINIENAKNKLLNSDLTYELIEWINKELTEEEKIILLKELTKGGIQPEDIAFLAMWFWFETWLFSIWENWEIKIPYINYWTGCIMIWEWDIYYGENDEDAYMKYIGTEADKIKIKYWTYRKDSLYTTETDNLEKKTNLIKSQGENLENWIDPEVYEFIHKIWTFTKIELNWWKDSIKAELYWKLTTWWMNLKLWGGIWLSHTHKWEKITSTTSIWASANILSFSEKWPQWKTSYKFEIGEKLQLQQYVIWGKINTKWKWINWEIYAGYKTWQHEINISVWNYNWIWLGLWVSYEHNF